MSMGIIESGEYNKVAGLGGESDGTVIESHTLLANTLTADTAVTVAQITVPKGKWMIFGQLHTQPFSNADNLLTLAISTNGTAAVGETVDQRQQVQNIWGFVHGMLLVNPTLGPETVKLVGVSKDVNVNTIKAEVVAIKVSD